MWLIFGLLAYAAIRCFLFGVKFEGAFLIKEEDWTKTYSILALILCVLFGGLSLFLVVVAAGVVLLHEDFELELPNGPLFDKITKF